MKKIIFALLVLICSLGAQAQYKQVNIGVGLDGTSIPVYIGIDIPVTPDITLGGELGWRQYGNVYYGGKNSNYYYSESVIHFLVNGNYHFGKILQLPKKIDIYLGLNVGFAKWTSNYDTKYGTYSRSSGLSLGGQLGFRYYFTDKIGLGLEFCGGSQVSATKLGLSIRF